MPPETPNTPPNADDEPRGACSGLAAWLEGLGAPPDRTSHRGWLEPHLWAALQARVDASVAERRDRWSPSGSAPRFV